MPKKNINATKKNKKKRGGSPKKKSSPKRRRSNRKSEVDSLIMRDVLNFLKKHPEKTFTVKDVASSTGLWREVGNPKLRALMDRLTKSGKLVYVDKGKYKYTQQHQYLTGKIQITRSGLGFLLMEEEDDIFINPSNTNKALNGDTVKVKILSRRRREGKKEGEVVKIIERSRTEFVGIVSEEVKGMYFFIADDPSIATDFYIPTDKLNGAKDNEKVFVKLLNWDRRSPEAEVISVLGNAGEHNTEMHAILLQYGFVPEFPPQVEAEAKKIKEKISKAEIGRRRDMREVPTFTIDPDDAKDFDDALSLQSLPNGNYEVGIHIADVSHYVKPGSELDKEAFQRATSVYLVDRTVPMLPEKLSNKVCSLRPQEEKLTYSAIFEMDANAKVLNYWIGRTVIFSDHRFTYDGAQAIIEGKSDGPLKEEVLALQDLAVKLREKRMKAGSVQFHSNEVKFELDEDDRPIAVHPYVTKDSNWLIEDFMLLANRTVSAHIAKKFDNPPLPSVYRIHDQPDPEKLRSLGNFVSAFGHKADFEKVGHTASTLNTLLKEVQGTPEQNVIETLAIRSMAKAIYSTKNVGHFGLGFEFYSHFTSPIRRYPDLMIHRLLHLYDVEKEFKQDPNILEAQLKHCSDRERLAAEAERASVKYKQVEFLAERLGDHFEGVVSGVIEAGFFVELEENMCEGFVPVRSMEDDFYRFNADTYSFQGEDSGQVIRLGDRVEVEIASTDLKRRKVDMRFVEKLPLSN
ncbi:MAG: ribonuclease R [Bacteroidota bacterium]